MGLDFEGKKSGGRNIPLKVGKNYFKKNYFMEWDPEGEMSPDRYLYAKERRYVMQLSPIKRGDRVLDLGAGRGRFSLEFARKGVTVVGVDISKNMVMLTKEAALRSGQSANINLVLCDAESLPFRRDTFDLINFVELIMHLPKPQKTLHEIGRVLKPHKHMILGCGGLNYRVIFYTVLMYLRLCPKIARWYRPQNISEMLKKANFQILRVRGVAYFPPIYVRIARNPSKVPLIPLRISMIFNHLDSVLERLPVVRWTALIMVLLCRGRKEC